MTDEQGRPFRRGRRTPQGDLHLSVEGYKTIRTRNELRIAPLTILSGVNSSGKSSFMQPFLLMKQTLDTAFDPGPLLLHGPNVKVTNYEQVLSRGKARNDVVASFTAGFRQGRQGREVTFAEGSTGPSIFRDVLRSGATETVLAEKPNAEQRDALRQAFRRDAERYSEIVKGGTGGEPSWEVQVRRNRCFLEPQLVIEEGNRPYSIQLGGEGTEGAYWVSLLRGIIHVPGLRGNPERAYTRSAVGTTFPGTFETYVASLIYEWTQEDPERLAALAAALQDLGLTWKVNVRRVNDASLELRVGRMPHAQQGGALDLVSVADVGFGVSQTLPVLVALIAAQRGQIVYIEQPEIHLHPRAQLALAKVLVAAARRGVYVVAETHSSLLIRGIQTAVAEGELVPRLVSLNWFTREPDNGFQVITPAEIDDAGRFGEWPVDFDDISRDADWAYLTAVERAVAVDNQ